jgi:hypothetical protein
VFAEIAATPAAAKVDSFTSAHSESDAVFSAFFLDFPKVIFYFQWKLAKDFSGLCVHFHTI